ncbi:MAG: hypothetical protein ABJG78_01530 [Cyclobacteriaceae bacterium]
MKYLLFLLITVGVSYMTQSQTRTEKTIAVRSGQIVEMNFKHPELISIKAWDQNEIKVVAIVSINNGGNDDAFEIEMESSDKVSVRSRVKNYEDLPRNIMIRHRGEDYFFNTSDPNAPEVQKFKAENGDGYEYMQRGVIMDITLEIMVPRGISLDVDAKHGLVEVEGFTKNIEIDSKFGGIDVSVDAQVNNSMQVRTKFGEVYSNLDMTFSTRDSYDIGRWVTLEGKGRGSSTSQYFKSEFGNVYLRKR